MKPAGERYRIAVDFDGVLHSYTTPWIDAATIPDPPVEGAIEWLDEISRKFDVVIHSTRAASIFGRAAMRDWFLQHGVRPALVGTFEFTDRKPAALAYLDDRAIRFEGPGTFPSADEIHRARPWNKPMVIRTDVTKSRRPLPRVSFEDFARSLFVLEARARIDNRSLRRGEWRLWWRWQRSGDDKWLLALSTLIQMGDNFAAWKRMAKVATVGRVG